METARHYPAQDASGSPDRPDAVTGSFGFQPLPAPEYPFHGLVQGFGVWRGLVQNSRGASGQGLLFFERGAIEASLRTTFGFFQAKAHIPLWYTSGTKHAEALVNCGILFLEIHEVVADSQITNPRLEAGFHRVLRCADDRLPIIE